MPPTPIHLSDPILQLPTPDSVRVVWFVETLGTAHWLEYGSQLERRATATATRLSRTQEDQFSFVGSQNADGSRYYQPTPRPIWRLEAIATGLSPGQHYPYRVCSQFPDCDGILTSERFTLTPSPPPGAPLKILLTSDHQVMPMVAANLQAVAATVGAIDAIFFAGDLVNVPDRASEWFDDCRGGAFFPCLQGRAHRTLSYKGIGTIYTGAPLLQNAPLFAAIGNHEVMGRANPANDLKTQFNDPIPRAIAAQRAATQSIPERDRPTWIANNSFNFDTVREIFSLPGDRPYYALTFGDIRLIVLFATCIWRPPGLAPERAGRYAEAPADLDRPDRWGHGQHIFANIDPGSEQYAWLESELVNDAYRSAKYRIVMLHHPPHSLGGNIVPAYTDPEQHIERDAKGSISSVRYTYPRDRDYLVRDIVPLLETAGTHLMLYGHSHLWNRFQSPNNLHFLETSNVGNTYGASWQGKHPRPVAPEKRAVATGNPNGLEPIVPTIAPLHDAAGTPLPYLASNEIAAFSILDTSDGNITSYRFDTRTPDCPAMAFDRFAIACAG